ncbi:histone acetyltransferase [Acrasis kona]|uniref:histone acetyltransferase n=1 Tax=Acrasis kona TaxID=1008807 RepID=A0AAW2ZBE4_9EUKA
MNQDNEDNGFARRKRAATTDLRVSSKRIKIESDVAVDPIEEELEDVTDESEGEEEDEDDEGDDIDDHLTPSTSIYDTVPSNVSSNAPLLSFVCINNDGQIDNLKLLLQLKTIFTRQLPNMPKPYTTRLVFDRQHCSMVGLKGGLPMGGITFRPFLPQGFIEIVFCAVTGDEQVRGYGSMLMNHLKKFCQERMRVFRFLTCADNGAVGYFRKQGFNDEIDKKDRAMYQLYIKDYNETTLMECVIRPDIDYLAVRKMIRIQRSAIIEKLKDLESRRPIHPGLEPDPKRNIMDIPGLAESGYKPQDPPHVKRAQLKHHLNTVFQNIEKFQHAWPFKEKVDPTLVHDYYDVIKEPMDLSTMAEKLKNNLYDSKEAFIHDMMLIIDNCRTYNNDDTPYYECATKVERYLEAQLRKLRRVL